MESLGTTVYNEFDILWANVTDPDKVSETAEGMSYSGIGTVEECDEFTLTGITSGTHKDGRICSFPVTLTGPIFGNDSEGEFRTYWKNLIRHNLRQDLATPEQLFFLIQGKSSACILWAVKLETVRMHVSYLPLTLNF